METGYVILREICDILCNFYFRGAPVDEAEEVTNHIAYSLIPNLVDDDEVLLHKMLREGGRFPGAATPPPSPHKPKDLARYINTCYHWVSTPLCENLLREAHDCAALEKDPESLDPIWLFLDLLYRAGNDLPLYDHENEDLNLDKKAVKAVLEGDLLSLERAFLWAHSRQGYLFWASQLIEGHLNNKAKRLLQARLEK